MTALAETVHFSTLIEGNELPIVEAERAARGELDPDTKSESRRNSDNWSARMGAGRP